LKFDKLRMSRLLPASSYTALPDTLAASTDCFVVIVTQGISSVAIPHPFYLQHFDESRCARR
jgi:hypothetical protein